MADALIAMGVPESQAKFYVEMAGGDPDAAVNLFLSMSAGGGGGSAATPSKPSLGWSVPDWYTLVWPEAKVIPDAWLGQGLAFDDKRCPVGIVQAKNGPCGVLAAVQAVVIARASRANGFSSEYRASDNDLADALAAILAVCRTGESGPIRACTWEAKVGEGVSVAELKSLDDARDFMRKNVAAYKAKGGCVLLVYSAMLTRGVGQVRRDMAAAGADPPLVITAHSAWLCSFSLVSLLLRGVARGDIFAFSQLGTRQDWDVSALGVGLLSSQEVQDGRPVCDSLKTPPNAVWCVHGGDHLTTLWSCTDLKDEKGATHTLYHYNGLPPGGPRLSCLTIKATNGPASKAPSKMVDTYFKPQAGEIESVVQASPEDKKARPDLYDTWRYEVMLAADDPSVSGAKRPPELKVPKFDQGPVTAGPWRCRTCYADRFKTMWFKLNPDGATTCQGPCKKERKDAGWSIWMDFKDLPPAQKATIHRREAPKIRNILWTKWPGAEIEWADDKEFGGKPPSA